MNTLLYVLNSVVNCSVEFLSVPASSATEESLLTECRWLKPQRSYMLDNLIEAAMLLKCKSDSNYYVRYFGCTKLLDLNDTRHKRSYKHFTKSVTDNISFKPSDTTSSPALSQYKSKKTCLLLLLLLLLSLYYGTHILWCDSTSIFCQKCMLVQTTFSWFWF